MELPRGTVTMVFTDVEGSTRLLHELGTEAYVRALEDHRRLLREAMAVHGGVEVEMQGDSFHFAFADPVAALAAAAEAQRALAGHIWEAEPVRVRMGVHSGEPVVSGRLYAGIDVHRTARMMSAGHGGQVLVSDTTRALVDERFAFRDLGEHRLEDLLAPLRLFQLGEDEFPPLRSLYRTNLPVPATPFLGRRRELEEIGALLAEGVVRLLTLTGPGGTGKTRLAGQAAAESAELYPDGIYWVDLSALRDPHLVLPAIAQTLRADGRLVDHIGDKRLLVVLDNFEQVIDSAPEVGSILSACPSVIFLVTSRELLRIRGEHEYRVPLLTEAEAVSLFSARSQLAATSEITTLCRRLDNLPLAIELAAARTTAISPTQLLERLSQRLDLLKGGRDADPRQTTLRATIDWSVERLTAEEQQLFARLAVFAGGCTLEAAETVCDAGLDTFQSLIEKSLVSFSNGRYSMLETVREYAQERLSASGELASIARRHVLWVADLCERARPELLHPSEPFWFDRLDSEQANVRTAIAHAIADGEGDLAVRISGAIWTFWLLRGHRDEGRLLIESALSVATADSPLLVDALWGAAKFAFFAGDYTKVATDAEELLSLGGRHDLPRARAIGHELLAMIASMEGDVERARTLYVRSAEIAREIGDSFLLASVANNLGVLLANRGDTESAMTSFEEALAIGRAKGDRHRIMTALANLGFMRIAAGDRDAARTLFSESLETAIDMGYRELATEALLGLGLSEEDRYRAVMLIGSADAAASELDVQFAPEENEIREGILTGARAELGEQEFERAYRAGQKQTLEDVSTSTLESAR